MVEYLWVDGMDSLAGFRVWSEVAMESTMKVKEFSMANIFPVQVNSVVLFTESGSQARTETAVVSWDASLTKTDSQKEFLVADTRMRQTDQAGFLPVDGLYFVMIMQQDPLNRL